MASIAADMANDTGGEVLLLGTVILPMPDLTAVLTSLILIISECAVQGRKFAQLVTLELILPFRNRRSLGEHVSMNDEDVGGEGNLPSR